MATDIEAIDSGKQINNISACCTTLVTANVYRPSILIKENTNELLTIENIENKYDENFDNISYYTLGNTSIIGG